jgi:uncharacterized membrane protein YqiK
MIAFIVGLVLVLVAFLFAFIVFKAKPDTDDDGKPPKAVGYLISAVVALIGLAVTVWSTAIYVEDNQGGVINVKFGANLPSGQIIATNGEKGPQDYVLPPGWHFGYMPWQYDLENVDNVIVQQGSVGVVTAMDGKALPDGQVYADAWPDRNQMVDGVAFLKGQGQKGPQLTVLTPGKYRYNPRLFTIDPASVLEVKVGFVAVVKANAGPTYDGEDAESVNGVPIVPNGNRGIWKKALTPDEYYMHPTAYETKVVQTTNRVFNYSKATTGPGDQPYDTSITVRTKDGFSFPVDVRVSIKISAEDAPFVVARLGDPDALFEKGPYTVIEQKVVLPLIRAIFRNTAEGKEALEFLTQRSIIEKDATAQFADGLKDYKVTTDGVYIADIGLDETEQGKKLLETQTDIELAKKLQLTYQEQTKAEAQRAIQVKAQEDADQEKLKAAADAKVQIADSEAKAAENRARGEAAAYAEKIKALGGVETLVALEALEKLQDKWSGDLPSIVVIGGENGAEGALVTKMLQQMMPKAGAKKTGLYSNR